MGTILVVEDDSNISTLLSFMLRRAGFEVVVVVDGRAALSFLASGAPFALAVLDCILPYVDGLTILKTIRQNPQSAATPVLMLSARALERDIVEALEAGANDYVVKPFQPDELMARIKRLTRGRVA